MSPPTSFEQFVGDWLSLGKCQIGQVFVLNKGEHGFSLSHIEDEQRLANDDDTLDSFQGAFSAREIALSNAQGEYRFLKSAPDLRKGWRLDLDSAHSVREALEHFYPAMLGTWFAFQQKRLQVTPLRATLERQTGMYGSTREITDGNAQTMVGTQCNSSTACLKTPLWDIGPGTEISSLPTEELSIPSTDVETPGCIPLLCAEACNHLVACARRVVKQQGR